MAKKEPPKAVHVVGREVTNPIQPARVLIVLEQLVQAKDNFVLEIFKGRGPKGTRTRIDKDHDMIEFDPVGDVASYRLVHERAAQTGAPARTIVAGSITGKLLTHRQWSTPGLPNMSPTRITNPPKRPPARTEAPKTTDMLLREDVTEFSHVEAMRTQGAFVTALTLAQAYDTAFAVVSPRVSFVEWKMYEVQSEKEGGWWPYSSYKGERLWSTWKEIEGARYIYVFRRPKSQANAPAVLIEELFLDEKGVIHATPMEQLASEAAKSGAWAERGKRGKPVAIGKTICFVRQLMGEPMLHYFFSSRVPLTSKLIGELQLHVTNWTQGIEFVPWDPNIVLGREGEDLRVPVLDPITIATHLHAFYIAASDDLTKYLTPVDDPDDNHNEERKKRGKQRQQKLLLAQLINSLLDADHTLVGKEDSNRLDNFLREYEEQVKYRKEWRNRWALYLSNWLRSRPIALLAEAHRFDEKNDFPQFLLHMANCHSRLSESPDGRDLLKSHFEQPKRFDWVQKYALGREPMSGDEFQTMRKLGSAPLEFIKEHVPVWMAVGKRPVAQELQDVLHKAFGADVQPLKIVIGTDERGYLANIHSGEGAAAKQEMRFVEKQEIDLLMVHGRQEMKPMWKGAVAGLIEGVELINFALALSTFSTTMKGDVLETKIWGFVELAGSGLDLATATMTFLKKGSTKTIAKLSFISAVVDTVMGARETLQLMGKGRLGRAVGSGMVTAGSMVIALGILAESSAAGPIGLLIVGTGYLVKFIFADDSDYQLFIEHSSFGKGASHRDESPGWYKTTVPFSDWDDDNLDEQLRAAVMLLCKFKIVPTLHKGAFYDLTGNYFNASWAEYKESQMRLGQVQLGWVPRGAKLKLHYEERFDAPTIGQKSDIEIELGDDDKAKTSKSALVIDASKPRKVSVQAPTVGTAFLTWGSENSHERRLEGVHRGLKKVTLNGTLEAEVGGVKVSVEASDDGAVLFTP